MGTWDDSVAYQLGRQDQIDMWTSEESVSTAARAIHRADFYPSERSFEDEPAVTQEHYRRMAVAALSSLGGES